MLDDEQLLVGPFVLHAMVSAREVGSRDDLVLNNRRQTSKNGSRRYAESADALESQCGVPDGGEERGF